MRSPITKRSILSDVARLFDPFGWLAPVIVMAKVLIQKLWLCSLGWDDELPVELREEWMKYRGELIHLQHLKIPRWLKTTNNNKDVQIHGFADASTQAYAAVVYLRIVETSTNDTEGHDVVHVTMIASRTKIAPLKQLSVPRLELCAAVLLAQLI
ncbi:jg22167, partial [Pararge aegeria aegeria]